MNTLLQLTPHDPLVVRDGRPFGLGQGRRMHGLPWPLPSVVAGSFRTALVKAGTGDFSGGVPQRLMQIAVAGVFPVHDGQLYLPAPNDALAEPHANGSGIKRVHRVQPQPLVGGCDVPEDGLQPVMLSGSQAGEDFKPAELPAWWPVGKYAEWLGGNEVGFDSSFLCHPARITRDHVCLDAERGAAAESLIFASSNSSLTHLPRFLARDSENERSETSFRERFAEITLSTRITIPDGETELTIGQQFGMWHPLGGERRLVHWRREAARITGWDCPAVVRSCLAAANKVRMILATPAVFRDGWKPGWLINGLEGNLFGVRLRLVGVCNHRWKAVSGWSLAPPRGPKPIRRMVPAGSVYFFELDRPGDAAPLADQWLQSVSDDEQERRDGFGLAVWGVW